MRFHHSQVLIVLIVVLVALGAAAARGSSAQVPRAAAARPVHTRSPRRLGPRGSLLFPALGARNISSIYLPPSYDRDTTRRFPVAYYLHGLSGDETDWLSKGSIDVVGDSLFARGAPETIVVLPDGDDGWYTTWVSPVAYRTCADTLHNECARRTAWRTSTTTITSRTMSSSTSTAHYRTRAIARIAASGD